MLESLAFSGKLLLHSLFEETTPLYSRVTSHPSTSAYFTLHLGTSKRVAVKYT